METFLEDSDASFQETMVDSNDINDEEVMSLIFDELKTGGNDERFIF